MLEADWVLVMPVEQVVDPHEQAQPVAEIVIAREIDQRVGRREETGRGSVAVDVRPFAL